MPVSPSQGISHNLDVALRTLSRSANKGGLWFGLAAAGALAARSRTRRAAIRGAGSLAATSLIVNTAVKPLFRRQRPDIAGTAAARRLPRQPWTTSFPSGHAASAAAFTCGAALEDRYAGLALAPVAAAVGYSRIHVGVHFVSDVLAGAALGAGVALALQRWWPVRAAGPGSIRTTSVPELHRGAGLLVFVNPTAGNNSDDVELIAELLSDAEIVELSPDLDVEAEVDRRIDEVRALGVAGGDGTMNSLITTALRHDLPVALFPSGTMNHFARAIGAETFEDTAAAVEAGRGVAVDVGTAAGGPFLNTASLGAYPEMVRRRDELAPRLGKWPAMVVATAQVLRRQQPMRTTIDGKDVQLWTFFVGNGRYSTRGTFPTARSMLDDGMLDVQYLKAGFLSRTKAVLAALAGVVEDAGYRRRLATTVKVASRDGPVTIARDGESGEARAEFEFGKLGQRLLVYRSEHASGPGVR